MAHNTFGADIGIEQLTDSQKQAVLHIDGALLVLAGPGSGKTRVITSRIANIINNGVRPYNICAITFTNKAAEEMRQRVAATGAGSAVHISTFHSLCVRILRWHADKAQIGANFSIYDTGDQKRCMKEVIKESGFDTTNFVPGRMLETISRLKNDLEEPESVTERADDYFTKALARIYGMYQTLLKKNNALDFDDLLVKTAFLLRDHPDVRSKLSERFKYLLVDEYQDTNHAQYQIAKGLALAHGNICVTGDPDQSIYRWRGADIRNILAFEEDWPNAIVVRLEENFRSTPQILALADSLILMNTNRKEKKLIAVRPGGSEPSIQGYADDTTECEQLAEQVADLIAGGANLNDIAVFYRVNSMSRLVEEAFVRKQIPYQVVRGVEFYARKEIRDVLSYLKLVVNADDDAAFLRAVNTHPRGIGKTTLERLANYAHVRVLTLLDAARQSRNIESIAKAAQGKLCAFAEMIERFGKNMTPSVAETMNRICQESGLMDSLRAGGEKQEDALANIGELISSAVNYDTRTEEPMLVDYLQAIALYSDTDAYDSSAGKVSLMTLHAAKGLEFADAFIIGLEEGILPHERSFDGAGDDLEEERRLFFVGITRAKDNLYISYARHRLLRGQLLRMVTSRFLQEIGFDYNEYTYDNEFDRQDFDATDTDAGDSGKAGAFRVNELVEHSKFGLGRVQEFIDLGADSIVIVRFNSGNTKSLMTKYAKLVRVGQ